MFKSIKHFAKLCVFSGNPADADGRTVTLVVLFLILLVLDSGLLLVAIWLSSTGSITSAQTISDAVVQVLTNMCVLLLIALGIYVVLHVRRVPQNFRHTFSSYLGVNIIIVLLWLLVMVATMFMSSHQGLSESYDWQESFGRFVGPLLIVVPFVLFLFTIWKILAIGYILYKSMEIKFWQAGVIAIMLIYAPRALEIFPKFFRFVGEVIGYLSA